MNVLNRRKLFLYSSLFITLALNLPKLLALHRDGIVARYWHFDLAELCFQTLLTFLFCVVMFYYNKDRARSFFTPWQLRLQGVYLCMNMLILGVFTLGGAVIQRAFFQLTIFPGGGNGLRFTLSMVLIAIELRVYFLLQESREKEVENEHLRNAYLKSQLALLRGQLNPHFFFNALSSLSAVVREDPRKAQQYITQLSKVFRYSLQSSDTHFVSLKEELQAIASYAGLLKMRYEAGFELTVPPEEQIIGRQIPPMSLQLLVENALKHNMATAEHPLLVEIRVQDHCLEVRNNRQPLHFPEPGAGIGLSNLNERFGILLQQEIDVIATESDFIVKLPLK